MEKKLYDLIIDPEFAALIPKPDMEDLRWLESSIKKEGCTDPLVVWNGTIIDGHNRYSICKRLGISFTYVERDDFPDRNVVKAWIIERQLARRNLTKYQKSRLAIAFEPILKEQARERQVQGGREKLPQNSSEAPKDRETRNKVAEIAGVSHDTIARVKKIDEVADEGMKGQLEAGTMSINKAYNTLFGDDTPDTVQVIGKKAIHVEGKMPDDVASFPVVYDLLEDVARNYLVSLEHILLQYTPGMATEENNKAVLSIFRGTAQEANNIVKKRIEEVSE